jgi:methylated-DNA-[protein]-cysteine S-methyltransferase
MNLDIPSILDHEILIDAVETPFGWLSFALTNKGLKASTFMYESKAEALTTIKTEKFKPSYSPVEDETAFRPLLEQWKGFFLEVLSGNEDPVPDVPVDDSQWTEFGKKVYHYLRRVPAGRTVTYGEVAIAVGSPGASRAVGTLMKKNPIPPVVPCHRVVGSGGQLGGFSASGGTDLKLKLLEMESKPTLSP